MLLDRTRTNPNYVMKVRVILEVEPCKTVPIIFSTWYHNHRPRSLDFWTAHTFHSCHSEEINFSGCCTNSLASSNKLDYTLFSLEITIFSISLMMVFFDVVFGNKRPPLHPQDGHLASSKAVFSSRKGLDFYTVAHFVVT